MNKAGCVLINRENKQIGLVYRKKCDDYSFPKGHLEKDETLYECAIRETEEETGRKCKLLFEKEIGIIEYTNFEGNIKTYMYLAIDEGVTDRIIDEKDKEELVWVNYDDVIDKLSYQNLKDFWKKIEVMVREI